MGLAPGPEQEKHDDIRDGPGRQGPVHARLLAPEGEGPPAEQPGHEDAEPGRQGKKQPGGGRATDRLPGCPQHLDTVPHHEVAHGLQDPVVPEGRLGEEGAAPKRFRYKALK